MNKTVNINLAGIFYHIDEDAYLKLQRYLEAIKRSFTDSQGRAEIIADIEARIAEIFSEQITHDKQVISTKEVDNVINIMGQPEDYLVDDEIFEDEPISNQERGTSNSKKLFRDTTNSYIAGVCAGLGHYLGLDAVWMRLLLVLLTLFSGGTFIIIYILFWILVPEAKTTAEKLTMTGEPVNISNIEKKIKDGFGNVSQTVSDTVKDIDLQKQGNRIKSGSQTFFDTIGNMVMFILKLFAKCIGLILITTGAASIFGLFISLVSFGSSTFFSPWWMDYPDALNTTGLPLWLGSLFVFFTFGIPFFFILYLGLKILINNLKSIGRIAKFTLLGLWLISLIGIITITVKQATDYALESSVLDKKETVMITNDTLNVKMVQSALEKNRGNMYDTSGFEIMYNDADEKVIFSKNVTLTIRSTKDSIAFIEIFKTSKGKNYIEAKTRANNTNYTYSLKNNTLLLSNFLLTDYENKYRDQSVEVFVYLPENTVINLHENTRSYLNYYRDSQNISSRSNANHSLKVTEDALECLDCENDDFKVKVNVNNETSGVKIDENGIKIKNDNVDIEINADGIKAHQEEVKVNINENGININTDNN